MVVSLGATAVRGRRGMVGRRVQLQPDYLVILAGMLLTGIGVGLTLPTLCRPPPGRPAALLRDGVRRGQHGAPDGLAVGVAVLVVVLGAPAVRPRPGCGRSDAGGG